MRRLISVSAAAALAAALLTSSALAKGVTDAMITGPGLDETITLSGEGQPGSLQLYTVVEAAGFYPGVFERSPNPMLADRPRGELGPRYTIAYTMPGPNNESDVILQDVYPYAQPEPVAYVEPGQHFFGTGETVGGWFVAGMVLRDALVAVGLPESAPPVGADGDGARWGVIAGAAVAACLAVLLVLALLARRRSSPAPA